MRKLLSAAILVTVAVGSAPLSGEQALGGCGTVQDWKGSGLVGTFDGHSFGEDVSGFDWRRDGESEPGHRNAHFAFEGGGKHNHTDHAPWCS